jgi:hypothetical protein
MEKSIMCQPSTVPLSSDIGDVLVLNEYLLRSQDVEGDQEFPRG